MQRGIVALKYGIDCFFCFSSLWRANTQRCKLAAGSLEAIDCDCPHLARTSSLFAHILDSIDNERMIMIVIMMMVIVLLNTMIAILIMIMTQQPTRRHISNMASDEQHCYVATHLLNGVHTNPPSSGDIPHHLLEQQHRGRGLRLYRNGFFQGLLQQVLVEL